MKNLIIIRHAKSDNHANFKDIDRPINQRGIEDISLVAAHFKNFIPEKFEIYSSISKRTSETAIIFANNVFYPASKIIFNDNLYTFEENKLENSIKLWNNEVNNAILFGHNNAITNFVNKFGDKFIDNVPTAGLVWLQFQSDYWNVLERGKIKKTIFPKNLK